MIKANTKIIAVDFDGTIVEDRYPEIGRPTLFAFETLKKLQEDGHRLILWTYRVQDKLDAAVAFCKDNGIEFYAVNQSYPGEDIHDPNNSRKIHADVFIDDRNWGGLPDWGEIYQGISGQPGGFTIPPPPAKKRWKLF
jgi:hydroxymethylpyrimidine pyrophosphatase-like HAD family hydrolase